jgi:hypothetical protein
MFLQFIGAEPPRGNPKGQERDRSHQGLTQQDGLQGGTISD